MLICAERLVMRAASGSATESMSSANGVEEEEDTGESSGRRLDCLLGLSVWSVRHFSR